MAIKSMFGAAVALAQLLLVMPSADAAEVTIRVEGLERAEGRLMVAMFDTAEDFPRGTRRFGEIADAVKGSVTVVFRDVPPGRYAASLYHDLNRNERLDANLLGIPSEPYGFSRNARGKMGPPKFDDAAFTVAAEPVNLVVQVK